MQNWKMWLLRPEYHKEVLKVNFGEIRHQESLEAQVDLSTIRDLHIGMAPMEGDAILLHFNRAPDIHIGLLLSSEEATALLVQTFARLVTAPYTDALTRRAMEMVARDPAPRERKRRRPRMPAIPAAR